MPCAIYTLELSPLQCICFAKPACSRLVKVEAVIWCVTCNKLTPTHLSSPSHWCLFLTWSKLTSWDNSSDCPKLYTLSKRPRDVRSLDLNGSIFELQQDRRPGKKDRILERNPPCTDLAWVAIIFLINRLTWCEMPTGQLLDRCDWLRLLMCNTLLQQLIEPRLPHGTGRMAINMQLQYHPRCWGRLSPLSPTP